MFTVELRDGGGTLQRVPAGVRLTPQRWSWMAVGGPDACEIRVAGAAAENALWTILRWLGWRVVVRNEHGEAVWWGRVHETSLQAGRGLSIGLSLESMRNRVQVGYTYEDAGGSVVDAVTGWNENAVSVDRYGYRELRHTLSQGDEDSAEKTRDRILALQGLPRPTPAGEEGEANTGVLRCRGYWYTLGDRYYDNPAGREAYETAGGVDQSVGVAQAASTIGFNAANRIVYNTGPGFLPGEQFVVSGSASNNKTFTVADLVEQETLTYTASTIAFSATDDLDDSGDGFDGLAVGDWIQVEGSASNDGIYQIESVDQWYHIEVDIAQSGPLTLEAAGASVTIRRRSYVVVVEDEVTDEEAGASVTLTATGQRVAQSFTQAVAGSWTVGEIAVRVQRVGSPTDNLKVALWSNSAGSPGSELDSGTIDGDEVSVNMGWLLVPLSNTQTINYGTFYWIVVSRTGSGDTNNYYLVDVDEQAGYALGGINLYNGSSWSSRVVDADMPFVVWGKVETSEQVATIVSAAGQHLSGTEIVDASGVETRQWRDGDSDARAEVEDLLRIGDAGGGRLLATVNEARRLVIYDQPGVDTLYDWGVYGDGRIVRELNAPVAPGVTPCGRWLRLRDLPGVVDGAAAVSPVFVEWAEYTAQDGRVSWRAEGTDDVWDVGRIEQG